MSKKYFWINIWQLLVVYLLTKIVAYIPNVEGLFLDKIFYLFIGVFTLFTIVNLTVESKKMNELVKTMTICGTIVIIMNLLFVLFPLCF